STRYGGNRWGLSRDDKPHPAARIRSQPPSPLRGRDEVLAASCAKADDPRRITPERNAMPAQVHLFMCLKDNFGVLLHDPGTGRTAAIDAPEAAPVEAALRATGWKLTDILVTHHHRDHTDGIEELKASHRCRVVAPDGEAGGIPEVDETVREGDTVRVGALEGRVIETPGHTSAPSTLHFPDDKLVFAGDTLFSIGCGRVMEGSMETMWQSMLKL